MTEEERERYVACVNEKVVGYIHDSDYECTYSDPLKNIIAIAIDEMYQGRAFGLAIKEALMKRGLTREQVRAPIEIDPRYYNKY